MNIIKLLFIIHYVVGIEKCILIYILYPRNVINLTVTKSI